VQQWQNYPAILQLLGTTTYRQGRWTIDPDDSAFFLDSCCTFISTSLYFLGAFGFADFRVAQ